MKNALLSLLLLSSAVAKAQQKGLWIMPQVTCGRGQMKDLHPASLSRNNASLFSLGLEIQKMFNDHAGIALGLSYGQYRLNTIHYSPVLAHMGDACLIQETVEVPVYGRWLTGRRNGFFIHAGFINSIRPSATQNLKFEQWGHTIKESEPDANMLTKRYAAMPFLYCGASLALGNALLTLGPLVQYQPGNNFKDDSGQQGHYLFCALKAGICFHGSSRHKHIDESKLAPAAAPASVVL